MPTLHLVNHDQGEVLDRARASQTVPDDPAAGLPEVHSAGAPSRDRVHRRSAARRWRDAPRYTTGGPPSSRGCRSWRRAR